MISACKLISCRLLHCNYTIFRNRAFFRNVAFNICCKYCTVNKVDLENCVRLLQEEHHQISERKLIDVASENRLQELSPIIKILETRTHVLDHLNSLKELLNEKDEELKKLAEEETDACLNKVKHIEDELLQALIPRDLQDDCEGIVLEVNAGVGGQEAMLFASELFDMYLHFCEYKGWTYQLAEEDISDVGGLRHGSALIQGTGVFRYFKYEAGVHRVQRIPITDKSGRVHTSTVSVVALPQPKDVDITVHDKDLRIDTKRASGAGGQHVNTTDSAVRIVHIPTGIIVECQVDRSQIKNRQFALERLKAKLYERELTMQVAKTDATRRSQVRSNYRNEKIRTYNFSQDRITDHRLQGSNLHNLKGFMSGGQQLDVLIDKLRETSEFENLKMFLNSVQINK